MIKVLTLNTWQERGPWQDRWKVAFDGIALYEPHIIAFQEVFNPEWAAEVKKQTGYPELVCLPDQEGLVFLSRYPVVQSEALTMKTQSPSEEYKRYAVFAELKTESGNLAVFNTHLSWKTKEGEVREKQVNELIEFIGNKSGNYETLAMGDFNAVPESSEIKQMTTMGKFTDTYAAVHPDDPGLTWDNRNPYAASGTQMPDRRIDYIFSRNAQKLLSRIQSIEIVFNKPAENGFWASDHMGLLAAFES